MEVVSHCPLPVAGRVWKPRPDALVLTFVCKATFTLAPGKLALAPEQQPIHEGDRPWSATVTSLYAPSDLVPRKVRPDVVLVGNAYAPGGRPVQMLVTRLSVGEVDKTIEVWCDRTLRADGSVIDGRFLASVPLLYERAAGGPGTDNPVGMAPKRDAHGSIALPNLTPQGTRLSFGTPIAPTGFGPIAARWPARLLKLGRHAESFSPDTWHEQPLPADLDLTFFNAAPSDQSPSILRGDEHIVLEHLHPDHPQLTMILPGLRPRAKVIGAGSEKSVLMTCDTLWIDTSSELCCLTYRGQVLMSSPQESGWVVVSLGGNDLEDAPSAPSLTSTLDPTGERTRPPPILVPKPRAPAMTLPFLSMDPVPVDRDGRPSALPFELAAQAPSKPRGGPESRLPFRVEPPPARAPELTLVADPIADPPTPIPWSPQPLPSAPGSGPGLSSIAAPVSESPWAAGPSAPGAGTISAVTAENTRSVPIPPPSRPLISAAMAPRVAPTREPPAVDLLFFDARSLPRMRLVPAWKKLVAALDERPLDAEEDDPSAVKDPEAIEDRREIMEILVRAEPGDAAAIDELMGRAVREDGRLFGPLVLLAGELSTPFDEIEALRATVTVVTPLAGSDEQLRASLEIARGFLGMPGLSSAPAVAEGLTARVRDAFNQGKRTVQPGYLDVQTERALVEQRCYQHRKVLGGRRQRALFHFTPAGAAPMVTYLPDAVAERLPISARFKVRMIARVHVSLDDYEQGPLALETLALARLVTLPRRS